MAITNGMTPEGYSLGWHLKLSNTVLQLVLPVWLTCKSHQVSKMRTGAARATWVRQVSVLTQNTVFHDTFTDNVVTVSLASAPPQYLSFAEPLTRRNSP